MYGSTHRAVLDSIMSELDGVVQKDTDRYKFYCPLPHCKEKASAEIWLDGQGKIAVCCHDCGRNSGLWQTVVGPRIAKANLTQKTTYTYGHPDGTPRISYRTDNPGGKRCLQPKGQTILGTYVKLWLPEGGHDGGPVVWVEGEKRAAAIAAVGFLGASSIAGANNVGKTDYATLTGRHVLVWPDDDQAGRKAGEVVANLILEAGAARLQLAQPPGLDDGSDAAELGPGERLARLLELLGTTPDL